MIETKEKNGYLILKTLLEGEPPKNGSVTNVNMKETTEDSAVEKDTVKKWYQFWKRG